LGLSGAVRSCLLLSVVGCAPSSKGSGAIHSDAATATHYADANFTACAAREGSVIQTRETAESRFSCHFLTVVKCIGETGLDSVSGGDPLVELSNLYNNSMGGSTGVLHARGTGLVIRGCVFTGNTRDVSSASGGAGRIRIEDCFFSVDCFSLASASFSLSGNHFLKSVSSRAVSQVGPELCAPPSPRIALAQAVRRPAAICWNGGPWYICVSTFPRSPSRTVWQSPSRTVSQSPSPTVSRSASPSRTISRSPTATWSSPFPLSALFTRSGLAATPIHGATDALSQSPLLSATAPASPSDPAWRISNILPSYKYRVTAGPGSQVPTPSAGALEPSHFNASAPFDSSTHFSPGSDNAAGGSAPTPIAAVIVGVVLGVLAAASGAVAAYFLLCRSKRPRRLSLSDDSDETRPDLQFVNDSLCEPDATATLTDSTTYEADQARTHSTVRMSLFPTEDSLPMPISERLSTRG
jgi:hypothetical protein